MRGKKARSIRQAVYGHGRATHVPEFLGADVWRYYTTKTNRTTIFNHPDSLRRQYQAGQGGALMTLAHGRYIGNDPKFKNKTALIELHPKIGGPFVMVQFDDRSMKEAFGWWQFEKSDFIVDEVEGYDRHDTE